MPPKVTPAASKAAKPAADGEAPKKRVSAKERKRLAELRKAEERAAAARADAEVMFQKFETERALIERKEFEKYGSELLLDAEDEQRIRDEELDFAVVEQLRGAMQADALEDIARYRHWETISVTDPLPDPDREPEVNSYASLLLEESAGANGGEDVLRDLDADISRCTSAVALLGKIMEAVDNNTDRHRHAAYMRRYRTIATAIRRTMNDAVGNVLHYLEKWQASLAEDDTDAAMTLCKGDVDTNVRLGLWAGNRVPRVRGVEFPDLHLHLAPRDGAHLPKELALMNQVAVLGVTYPVDLNAFWRPSPAWVSAAGWRDTVTADPTMPDEDPDAEVDEEDDDFGEEWVPVGGAFSVELVSVPAAARHAKEWIIRSAPLRAGCTKIRYPPNADAVTPPVRISFEIPKTVFVRNTAPIVGVWNAGERRWDPELTTDFSYDATHHRVTFVTRCLSEFAVLQHKSLDVPYADWVVAPVSPSEVLVKVTCKVSRDDPTAPVIGILVRGDRCVLVEPVDEATDHLRSRWLPPCTLLRMLSDCGFNLVLTDADAGYSDRQQVTKSEALESRLYRDIAWLAGFVSFASAEGNLVGESDDLALFRMARAPADMSRRPEVAPNADSLPVAETPAPPAVAAADYLPIRYSSKECVVIKDGGLRLDGAVAPDLNVAEGHVAHARLLTLIEAMHGADVIRPLVEEADPLLAHCLERLLRAIRPVTWG